MTLSNHHKWMNTALELAARAAGLGEIPVGCVIVRGDELISAAYNQREILRDVSAHAEMVALRAAGQKLNRWRLDDCSMYVTLEPCVMCLGAILQARIEHLYFGAFDPKTGACGSLAAAAPLRNSSINHHTDITGGLLEDQCAAQLRRFFRSRRLANRELGGRGKRRLLKITEIENHAGDSSSDSSSMQSIGQGE